MIAPKHLSYGLGLIIYFISTCSYAFMSIPYGWYIEGNLGVSRLIDDDWPGTNSSYNPAGNINLGYKFMPFFALEVGYTQYSFTSIYDPATDARAAIIRYYSYDVAGKGIVPIVDSGVELFAKLGVGRNNAQVHIRNTVAAANIGLSSSNKDSTGLFIGAGGQYYFNPALAGVLQWQRMNTSGKVGVQDLFSLGFSYIFD